MDRGIYANEQFPFDTAFSSALEYTLLCHRRCTMTSGLSLSQVLLQRVTRDYQEQPALRLTPPQAQRLWDLDGPTCGAVLTALVDAGILQRTSDGQFVRRPSVA